MLASRHPLRFVGWAERCKGRRADDGRVEYSVGTATSVWSPNGLTFDKFGTPTYTPALGNPSHSNTYSYDARTGKVTITFSVTGLPSGTYTVRQAIHWKNGSGGSCITF